MASYTIVLRVAALRNHAALSFGVHINAWEERMGALPSVVQFRPSLPPRGPMPHAREWAIHHRPLA